MKAILLFWLLFSGYLLLDATKYTEYVNPQLIRDNNVNEKYCNHCLGSTLPFGRTCVYLKSQNESVRESDSKITNDSFFYGFGHAKNDNPDFNNLLDVCLRPVLEEDKEINILYKILDWKPGYCKILLEDSIIAETTATLRTGIHNYTYPQGKNKMLWISFFQDLMDSTHNKRDN